MIPDEKGRRMACYKMKTFFLALLTGLCLALVNDAEARLEVVATTPDLGSIAEAVGGDRVSVTSLARGTEDAHFTSPRPSFIRVLNRADVLIENGAELEVGWLPPLVRNARNRAIIPGNPGRVKAADGVSLLDIPEGAVDRTMGDVHVSGNPHFLLDPLNAKIVAETIAAAFIELDPEGAGDYQSALETFQSRIDEKMEEWKEKLEPYEGTQVVTYHATYRYFAERFGFETVAMIEPLPGVEPTPRHLRDLIQRIRDENIRMIWAEPFRPSRSVDRVGDATDAVVLRLPELVGGVPDAEDYISLIDYNVRAIVDALDADSPEA